MPLGIVATIPSVPRVASKSMLGLCAAASGVLPPSSSHAQSAIPSPCMMMYFIALIVTAPNFFSISDLGWDYLQAKLETLQFRTVEIWPTLASADPFPDSTLVSLIDIATKDHTGQAVRRKLAIAERPRIDEPPLFFVLPALKLAQQDHSSNATHTPGFAGQREFHSTRRVGHWKY